MSNGNDSLIDKDGIVHEKGWDGQYHPKQGLFGPERDTSWTGQPNVERDWLGRPQEERDWLGRPVQSRSGDTLYRRPESGGSGSTSSASGAEAILALIAAVAILAIGLIGVVIAATPIIAPILLATTEGARKRGNLAEVKKWESWGVLACLMAVLVVFGIASMIGLGIFSGVAEFAQNTNSSILTGLIYLLAIAIGLVSFALSFITGISPTAVVYLRNKEAQLRTSGKPVTATRVRRLNWAIGITAVGTVALTVTGFVIVIIAAVAVSFLSG